ncbi:MAG: tetratricopeptide repeat protein, partial [Rhodospirillales bacterium]|nr:tetratricopeptide repeat protein [Rhodospirillales bacterium]
MGRSKLRKKKKTPQGSSINLVKTLEETIAHYKAGRLVECLQGCRKILTVDKHNPNIFKLAGDLEAKVGDPIQAEDYLNAAVKFAPRDADAHYLLAGAQMTNGRIENAIKSYNSALQIRPDYIEAYNNLAIAEMSMGDYESAQGSLQSLIGLKPDHATAHYNLGSIFMRQDRI